MQTVGIHNVNKVTVEPVDDHGTWFACKIVVQAGHYPENNDFHATGLNEIILFAKDKKAFDVFNVPTRDVAPDEVKF